MLSQMICHNLVNFKWRGVKREDSGMVDKLPVEKEKPSPRPRQLVHGYTEAEPEQGARPSPLFVLKNQGHRETYFAF
jgi:hypothetical protein